MWSDYILIVIIRDESTGMLGEIHWDYLSKKHISHILKFHTHN